MGKSYYEGLFRAQEEQIVYLVRLQKKLREEYEALLEEKEAEIARLRNMAWTNGDVLKESQAEAVKLRGRVIRLRSALRAVEMHVRRILGPDEPAQEQGEKHDKQD